MIERPTDPEILTLAEKGNAEDALEWFRQEGSKSLYFWLKVILGYPDLTEAFHKPMCRWLESTESNLGRMLLAPRKFLKSTCVKGWILRKLTKDPMQAFLFVGENDAVGAKNLIDLKWHIRSNVLFQKLYPALVPADYGKNWSETSITIPRPGSRDEPTIQTVGIGAKGTGFHYTGILYDDPIGLEAANSEAEMMRAWRWFQAASGLFENDKAWELIVGTRWRHGKGDLYGRILKELPYRVVRGRPEGYATYIRSCYNADGSPAWPERYPLHVLEALRKRMGTYLFNANMVNNPTAKDGGDFPTYDTYRMSEDRQYAILDIGDGDEEKVRLADLVRVIVYDPSSGGKQAEAENAIVVAGMDSKRRILALDVWAKNCGFGLAIENWHRLNDKWKPWRNWYEAVGAHKAVDEMMKMRPQGVCTSCGKVHRKLRAYAIKPDDRNKEDRIRALAQPAFEEGRVFIGTHLQKLRTQVETFPYGDLVDVFDAFAYAVSKLRPPLGYADDEDREHVQAPVRAHHARSFTEFDYGGY